MKKHGTSWLAILAAVVAIAYATPADADPIVITGGSVGFASGIDLQGFTLTGSDSLFTGVYFLAGTHVFAPGDVVHLDAGVGLSTFPGQPTAQVVNGTSFPSAFVNGSLTFRTVPFTAPEPSGPTFSFSTPFTASGAVEGFADAGRSIPLFSVDLAGSGIATVSGLVLTGVTGGPFVGRTGLFGFRPGPSAPTPEPVSGLLVGAGAACLMLWRRMTM